MMQSVHHSPSRCRYKIPAIFILISCLSYFAWIYRSDLITFRAICEGYQARDPERRENENKTLDRRPWDKQNYSSTIDNCTYSDGGKTLKHVENSRVDERKRHCPVVPAVRAQSLDCATLFRGSNRSAEEQVASITASTANNLDLSRFMREASESWDYCKTFWRERCYVDAPLTDEEARYPIAYSMLIYKDVVQFERLLRVIYRPQNYYCVHVDSSSPDSIHLAARTIASCFHNVFLASRSVDVEWADFTVLEAELICMKDLIVYKAWKYFINLTGQEFPLKTNLALVRILKALNGSNNIDGTISGTQPARFAAAPELKLNVTLIKGSAHIVATRAFVKFAIESETGSEFTEWVRHTYCPDETFFASLNHSPHLGVPGSYTGTPEMGKGNYLFIARYKLWATEEKPCSGKINSALCIFGVGDLQRLGASEALFANKFHADFQPAGYDCMEEWIFNRTRGDLEPGAEVVNTTFYARLDHVKNHVPS